jgi:uncharacterized cupredoxin-like copper-binding protein
MRQRKHTLALVGAAIAVALALAGAALAALTSHSSTSAAASATIKVTEREYHIALSTQTVKAGSVKFSVHNIGHLTHGLDLSGGGLSAVKKLGTIAPGTTRTLTVKFAGGKVTLWCPVPGHAALGMKTSLKVTGGGAKPPPSTTGGTSTGGGGWG